MDILPFTVPQLQVAINCLLDAAGDKDEVVRENVSSSLRRIAKKYAVHVLQNAVVYRQKNAKLSVTHLTTILTVMEHICEEQADQLDDIISKQLSMYCVEEMTKCAEYLPTIQFPVSNTLVALGQRNCSIVMRDLVTKLPADTIPHYTVLHTLANLAAANVSGFVPFIKATLDMLLPLMPSIRNEPIRQVFSFALGKFSEAILEYLSTQPKGEGDITVSVTRDAFTDEITTAYDILLSSWLNSRESKIIENVVVAVGPMYPLVEKEKKVEYAQRTMSVLLNLYRRSQPPMVPTYPVTQCLASILQAAPTSAIEPLYDSLISVLGAMVITAPDYTNPLTVKNHSEVLRCYDRLGCHFPERMADMLVLQLSSGSERDRVEALVVAAHLLSGSENVLQPRISDITAALRLLLNTSSVKIKKVLVKAIVSLACRGNTEDGGSDFVEFLVRHCCPSTSFSGPDWDELTAMCCSTVYLLSSTVSEVQNLLWAVLLRLLLIPEYDAACATIARSLALLATKVATNYHNQNVGVPSPAAVFTRCMALLGSPLNANRGPHLLAFLTHYCAILQSSLCTLWAHKIPQLINFLEVSEWSESQWEALLLEFVSSSLQASDSEEWVMLVASHVSAQLVRNTPTPTSLTSDERGMLLKCLAVASCCLTDRQVLNSHLDVMLNPLRHYSHQDSKACARGVGMMAKVHLNLVLTRLDQVTHTELSRRPSRLLGLMKDPRVDFEVERARVGLLRCYAEVASQAPASALLPRLDNGLMAWVIAQLSQAKDATTLQATLSTVASFADTLDRHRDTYTENLKCRDQLLVALLSLIHDNPVPDPLTLRVTASVVKLPPELSPEVRGKILRTCFERVFTSEACENSVEDKLLDSSSIKNLGFLVEELLIDDVSLATLDDISTLLEVWLVQRKTQQRVAAVYILKTTLQAYYHHMSCGYELPSKFNQSGTLLGRCVLRSLDEDVTVRTIALDCAQLVLLISAKYDSLSSADVELSLAFSDITLQDPTSLLSKVIASKLPHNQLSHFADTMLRGLSDMEPTLVDSVSDIMTSFFQAKGGELYHHINDIVVLLLSRLAVVNPSSRGGAVRALLALARHHPKVVLYTLLAQPLPLHTSICDCWKALATDTALAADIIDQFLRILKTTPLLNEDNASSDRQRPKIAALLPFAVVSAMCEMFLVAAMHELAVSHFAELLTQILMVFAAYVGVTPPICAPASNKAVFIPNREAYKIIPARVAQDCLKNFLLCSQYDSVAETVVDSAKLDVINNFDYFLAMIPAVTEAICTKCGHQLPKILSAMEPFSNSVYVPQRAAVTAFNCQCVELQCAGQIVLIDGILSCLLTSLSDSAPLVGRLSLKGLANISFLDPSQRGRHCESILEALIQGLDDHDTECQGDVALQAMSGLSQVLPSVSQAHVRDIQVAVALRIKPFFDKEDVELRTMSLRLMGELAMSGGEALPGFQDQVRASLVCILLHLRDSEPSVIKACKFSLRAVSNILEAEKTKAMMKQHLIDDATLHFQEFITDLAKLLVEEMTDQIPVMIMTALGYGKSSWPSIRASSTLFIGALYSCSPSYVRERVSLEAITLRLQQQVKDPKKEVRSAASHAFSLLFISPT